MVTKLPNPGPTPGTAAVADTVPRADVRGTTVALVGIVITALSLSGQTATDVARHAAYGVGFSIVVSILADFRHGLRNLVRADLLGLLSFYFLTLFEFFFPHPEFNNMADVPGTRSAVLLCLLSFAGLLVGRHLSRSPRQPLEETMTRPVPQGTLLLLFWSCMVLGFFHMFIAVDFDIVRVVNCFMDPRFSQPWGRGRFGDWKALLVELAMLLFLVPPLAGIIFARRRSYGSLALLTTSVGLAFLFFYGFSSGTRYLFHSFLITFVIGYAFGAEKGEKRTILLTIIALVGVAVIASTVLMLQFRGIGLKNYLQGRHWETEPAEKSLSVDLNLYSMGALIRVFPAEHDFIGLEVPYLALIRPIPRALWPGKPEGMSMSIEDAVGAGEGWTVAATFAGEAYMSGGYLATFGAALFFGYLTAWWNRLGSPNNSQFGILIYASGFFAAVISMRSIFFFTTALLPTLAAIVGGRFLIGKGVDKFRELNQPRSMPRPQRPLPAR